MPHEEVPNYISAFDVGTIPFDLSNPTAYYSAPNKMWEYLSQKRPVISTPVPEVVHNSDCVMTALTPEDYAQNLLCIAKEKREVYEKVDIGYRKALKRTWKNSAKYFASVIHYLLDQG